MGQQMLPLLMILLCLHRFSVLSVVFYGSGTSPQLWLETTLHSVQYLVEPGPQQQV